MINRATENVLAWTFIILFWGIIALIPLSIIYKFVAPAPLYQLSDGTMISKSAKLSHKGWVWKTWEGWIPVGVNSEGGLKRWYFTVKDGNQTVIDCIDSGKQVRLHYKDYVLLPYRMGSSHQVDKCEILGGKDD